MENVSPNVLNQMVDDPMMKKGKDQKVNIAPEKQKKKSKKARTIEETYQKKSQYEHILLRPDTYIGSVVKQTDRVWVFDEKTNKMKFREISYVPGLYKIFDEIIVNAADNRQRDPNMDELRVDIDESAGSITIFNNGKGIPIEMHKEHKIYVPELIFGNLLTSSNYDDTEEKTTGGRNGYGAKLTNIFSKEFVVETIDAEKGKHYKQMFTKNMSAKQKPKIKKARKNAVDCTIIMFKPDFEKFGMTGFDADILSLFKKRVYDIAGTSDKGLKVFLNGEKLKCDNFKDYALLYLNKVEDTGKKNNKNIVHARFGDRWEVMVCPSESGHAEQVSFVNSICTIKGGKHVTYITDQLAKKLLAHLKKGKNKKSCGNLKKHHIVSHMMVFVNCLIINPAFGSQTKQTLTTNKSNFGSECVLTDGFIKKVQKSDVIGNILAWATFKNNRDLKKGDGKKKIRLLGIPKLEDANLAGGRHGHECTLILTEGDSAKALAIAGLSVPSIGRERYGVFPLKGKFLNVRDASVKVINNNNEVVNLMKIIGLKHGKDYTEEKAYKQLRYGTVMVMTDQDDDGSHIKGLVINFFATFWPSLLKKEGFLVEFITPILKASRKGKEEISFFTQVEYEDWKEENNQDNKWRVKYYKGLGTSTAPEAKKYFRSLALHKKGFREMDCQDEVCIDKAFNRKKADKRKEWIAGYVPGTFLDQGEGVSMIKYEDFIDKELILFSIASNKRAIPCIVDGLKPGQRKILYCCFLRNLKREIKVAQLQGYVSEKGAYHHGEAALGEAIIKLAQNYTGSNNVNLLAPKGQFGTRLEGGKDHASPRYIFTHLNPISHTIFNEKDTPVLNNLVDDGRVIEPEWYCPVIPTLLCNGTSGIGTGWSTNIPNFKPMDIVNNLRRKIEGGEFEIMHPWYHNFVGDIEQVPGNLQKYICRGKIEVYDETTFQISELPVGKWVSDYKKFLETLIAKGLIKDVKAYHTDTKVDFRVEMKDADALMRLEEGKIYEFFKLTSNINLTNMVLFDHQYRIKKYTNILEILEEFYTVRLEFYGKRKVHLIKVLKADLKKLSNRVRFIKAVINQELIIRNRKKVELLAELQEQGYDRIPKKQKVNQRDEDEDEDDNEEKEENEVGLGSDYDYLLSMSLWSLTWEKVKKLTDEWERKKEELETIEGTSEETMWLDDLEIFEDALLQHEAEYEQQQKLDEEEKAGQRKSRKGGKNKSKPPRKRPVKVKKQPQVKKEKVSKPKVEEPQDLMARTMARFSQVSVSPAPAVRTESFLPLADTSSSVKEEKEEKQTRPGRGRGRGGRRAPAAQKAKKRGGGRRSKKEVEPTEVEETVKEKAQKEEISPMSSIEAISKEFNNVEITPQKQAKKIRTVKSMTARTLGADDDDDDDDFDPIASQQEEKVPEAKYAAPAPKKKKTAAAPKAKGKRRGRVQKKQIAVLEDSDISSPIKKRGRKGGRAKKKAIVDDDFNFEDEVKGRGNYEGREEICPRSARRPTRTRKVVSYADLDDSESDESVPFIDESDGGSDSDFQ